MQGGEPLLFGLSIDICANDECDEVEERNPGVLRKELLREGQGQRRCDPADFHDRHEASSHGRPNLMPRTGSSDDSHASQIDGVLNGRNLRERAHVSKLWQCASAMRVLSYNEIAGEDLQNLGLQTRATSKELLQDADQDMSHRRADEGTIRRHLRHPRTDVVAMLALIMSKP